MQGSYTVRVQNSSVRYEFKIKRNITVIQGNSATGKTTLVDLIREYMLNGADSGIMLTCDVPCKVLEGLDWYNQLRLINRSLIFIDEGNSFIESQDFATAIKQSDNYYVIVTRESLSMLPYSVDEIYGIHSSGKYNDLQPVYHDFYRIYTMENEKLARPDCVIVEDSQAGYEFFREVYGEDILCITAKGKSNVFEEVNHYLDKGNVLVVADGAAFGSEMNRIVGVMKRYSNVMLYLPESFEWLLLSANIFEDKSIKEMLLAPEMYIESSEFFSWEQFFTRTLIDKSQGTYLQYKKEKLNRRFLDKGNFNKIIKCIPSEIRAGIV